MRILVVEDYEPVREAVAQGLRESGFAVDTASDGDTGLWCAKDNAYDVIILDLMLPGMDGLTILKKLREKNTQTHVLILTAKDTDADCVRGLDLGADDYLIKPFAFAELLARVRALIRRKYISKNPVIRIGNLEIHTTARCVRRGGITVDLSPREYSLLEYLALRRGEVVTRTEIWAHVYEFNSVAESNVVDVFIAHLRRKLEQAGLPRLIQTRRGHGYILDEVAPREAAP